MKNFVRVMSVALVVSMLAVMLVSCGGVPAGRYVAGDTTVTKSYTQYEFSGSKFTFTTYVLGNKVDELTYEGKYKVKDGSITFTWKDADGESKSDTVTYVKNEDGSIKLGLVTFTKDN